MGSGDLTLESTVKALVVAAEVMGTELSDAAAIVMASELRSYTPDQVAGALRKCTRQLKGKLTLAAVLERIDDGRPGSEEAWAMARGADDESQTIVWTEEMCEAFGSARELLIAGDAVAARMAFREAYEDRVERARDAGDPVRWSPSLGHDATRRVAALVEAAERGRLSADWVLREVGNLPGGEQAEKRLAPLLSAQLPADAS